MIQGAARAWPAALLLALPLTGHADPQAVIAQCAARIDTRPTGLTQLEKSCPGLEAALEQAQVGPLLIDSSSSRLDRHSLLQLQRLLRSATAPAPRIAALQPVLRQLTSPPPPHRSWLQRLWDWLVDHVTPPQQPASSGTWLSDFVRRVMSVEWLWTAIIWCTLITLPIGVAIIVWLEVRAMGVRSTDERLKSEARAASGLLPSQLALLRAMPLSQRPALLFALLIGRLIAAGRLPSDRSLTHREVARKAILDDAEQRRLIERLAGLSERQLYATQAGAPEGLTELLARGEDLYTTGWGRPTETPL